MEIGSKITTLVDKITSEGLEEIVIPKGTIGLVCEIHGNVVMVEIWGKSAPKGVEGVFDYALSEISEI